MLDPALPIFAFAALNAGLAVLNALNAQTFVGGRRFFLSAVAAFNAGGSVFCFGVAIMLVLR